MLEIIFKVRAVQHEKKRQEVCGTSIKKTLRKQLGGGETYSTQLHAELDHRSQKVLLSSVITSCLPLDPAPCLTHIPTQSSPPQRQLHCTRK